MPRVKVTETPEFTRYREVIGANLRTAREKNGLSQAEVARKLGKAGSWVTEVEKGRSNLYIKDLVALAILYNYPVDYLIMEGKSPASWRVPSNLAEWEAMFGGDTRRAALHYNIDRMAMSAADAS